jgi:hypothetical protein
LQLQVVIQNKGVIKIFSENFKIAWCHQCKVHYWGPFSFILLPFDVQQQCEVRIDGTDDLEALDATSSNDNVINV